MADCNGCGACCGPVSCTSKEAQKIAAFVERRKISWQQHDDPLTCGFYDVKRKRCRIYSVRPFACRAFGVVTEMKQSLPARDAALDLTFNKGIAERAITEWRAEKMGLAEIEWHEGTLEGEMERVREIVRGRRG